MNKRRFVIGHILIAAVCCIAFFAMISGCDQSPGGEAVIEVKDENGFVEDTGTVDFGSCAPGSTLDKSFVLQNNGNNAVEIKDISVSNDGGSEFELATAYQGSLEAGGEKNFDINFTPTDAGSFSGNVRIDIGGTEDNFNFSVTGTGAAPDIEVRDLADKVLQSEQDEIYMGDYSQFEAAPTYSFPVKNVGNATLIIESIDNDPADSIGYTLNNNTLEQDQDTTLDITAHTDVTGNPVYVSLTLNTNDPNDQAFVIYFWWNVN